MNAYRLSRYGYRAWQIERLDKGQWRPFKYPGNEAAAAAGLVDLALAEFTTGSVDDLAGVREALEQLRQAVTLAEQRVSEQLAQVQDTAVLPAVLTL